MPSNLTVEQVAARDHEGDHKDYLGQTWPRIAETAQQWTAPS